MICCDLFFSLLCLVEPHGIKRKREKENVQTQSDQVKEEDSTCHMIDIEIRKSSSINRDTVLVRYIYGRSLFLFISYASYLLSETAALILMRVLKKSLKFTEFDDYQFFFR